MVTRRRAILVGAVAVAAGLGCRASEPAADPRLVTEWARALYALVRAERLSPPVASRVFAYGSVALYEGLAPGSAHLRSLAGQLNGLAALPAAERGGRYDWSTVAVSAERTVLGDLFRDGLPATRVAIAQLADSQIAARAAHGSSALRERSLGYGSALGRAILQWAAGDQFLETRSLAWRPPRGRGLWVSTAEPDQYSTVSLSAVSDAVHLGNPADTLVGGAASERVLLLSRPKPGQLKTLAALNPAGVTEPHWGRLRPFVLTAADECAPPPPPAPYSEERASAFYREVKAVYDTSRTLTPEQREIALYWADTPGQTGTPGGHWLLITSQLVDELDLDAERAVEAFVLTSLGMADAFISCWHEKFSRNLVRPVSYIRRFIDPQWHTLIPTPPFPEYTAGHAVQSGAVAGVLTALFGDRSFADSTHVTIGRPVRRFASFRAAADEVARSRLYAGLHYPMSLRLGLAQGECVARQVMERVKTRRPQ